MPALILPAILGFPAPAHAQGTPVQITESFDTRANADADQTGAAWGGGQLAAGYGGGSGRLGALRVPAGATVTLNTDFEDFAAIADPSVFDPGGVIDGAATVTGGFFDFSTITVEAGGTLRFVGGAPARLHARGVLDLSGTVDVSGAGAAGHDSADPFGGLGAAGGPGAADGGAGADQPDGSGFAGVIGGGFVNPNAMVDGAPGGGIPEPSALLGSSFVGGGGGAVHFPPALPVDPTDIAGVEWDIVQVCQTKMVSAPGGGGGYALGGGAGVPAPVPGAGFPATPAPATGGGDPVALHPAVRELIPERGLLRGGSGGGGGGAHIVGSQTDGKVFADCTTKVTGASAEIIVYSPHSSAGGGGGGGALEAVAGSTLSLSGRIDASGGDGGAREPAASQAMAGGGGSGGAIRLLARTLQQGAGADLLDVSGGAGGFGYPGAIGGAGSPGLVRVESVLPPPDAGALGAALSPDPAELASAWGATVDDVLSVGAWQPETVGPAALSGAASCWRTAASVTSFLDFEADQPGLPGWDMAVVLPGVGPVSWRGANPLFPLPLEQLFGSDLFGSPLVVRFQGARSAGPVASPCALELHGPGAGIVPGSLSPWVRHPAELDAWTADPAKRPDLIRFQILFDRANPFASVLAGVDDVQILATAL